MHVKQDLCGQVVSDLRSAVLRSFELGSLVFTRYWSLKNLIQGSYKHISKNATQ